MGVVIVTPAEIAAKTVNKGLLELYKTQEGQAEIIKYESIVADKIWSKIDAEQFNDGENYVIPDDLKTATISLVENFYTYAVVQGENNATKKVVSRKIDDFSETFTENQSGFSYFGIPTDAQTVDILNKYMGIYGKGFRAVHVR